MSREVKRPIPYDPDDPMWSFKYHTIGSRQEAKGGPWKPDAAWKVEATLDVRFFEPFQWFAQGDDWYFVTRSGKLYRAPRPAKGTHRKIDLVWADPDRPVRLFVTDADAGRTFLFIGPGASGKPAFFEAAEKAKLVEHDPIRVPDGKGPEHLRKVLAYAAVLREHGLVKVK